MHSYHKARRIQGTLALCFVLFGTFVGAQNSQVPTCVSSFELKDNDGLTPCMTLSNVMSKCNTTTRFTLRSILTEPLGIYPAPTSNVSTLEKCQCTEVGYNLYSACAACQVGDDPTHWLDHNSWFGKCTSGEIPILPGSEAIDNFASWITQPYGAKFSLTSALSLAAGGSLITATAASNSASPSASGSTGSSITDSSSSGPGGTSTPIIIGAVIGSLAFLAILALLAFFWIHRRQKQRTAPSAEFMKYAQGNTPSAREPLRSQSRANTGDEEHGNNYIYNRQSYPQHRGSVIRLDSPPPGGGGGRGENGDRIEMSEGGGDRGVDPPAFTPGLFKDPIFEKGVALNLAAAASGPYGGSPATYSPATPSTLHHASGMGGGSERQGLIRGHVRQSTE